jgi:hypothetical protein
MQFFQLAYVIKLNLIYSPTIQKKLKKYNLTNLLQHP